MRPGWEGDDQRRRVTGRRPNPEQQRGEVGLTSSGGDRRQARQGVHQRPHRPDLADSRVASRYLSRAPSSSPDPSNWVACTLSATESVNGLARSRAIASASARTVAAGPPRPRVSSRCPSAMRACVADHASSAAAASEAASPSVCTAASPAPVNSCPEPSSRNASGRIAGSAVLARATASAAAAAVPARSPVAYRRPPVTSSRCARSAGVSAALRESARIRLTHSNPSPAEPRSAQASHVSDSSRAASPSRWVSIRRCNAVRRFAGSA